MTNIGRVRACVGACRALIPTASLMLSVVAAIWIANASAQAAGKDTLVVASGAEAVTLDPGVSFDGQSPLIWRGVYESLLQYQDGTLNIVPSLAESYKISDDKLTYTFKLRPGIKFTDGETLNSAAVKFNIERQIGDAAGHCLCPGSHRQASIRLTTTRSSLR